MAPRSLPFLEHKRCSEGFFVQKGLVGVICNGNTASETTMRAAPIVLRVRLTFDELDACDLIFSPPTSVGRSDCGTSPHTGRARPAHSRVHRSSCRDMPPSTRRPPAWIESDESYAFRFLLPAESLDQNWPYFGIPNVFWEAPTEHQSSRCGASSAEQCRSKQGRQSIAEPLAKSP